MHRCALVCLNDGAAVLDSVISQVARRLAPYSCALVEVQSIRDAAAFRPAVTDQLRRHAIVVACGDAPRDDTADDTSVLRISRSPSNDEIDAELIRCLGVADPDTRSFSVFGIALDDAAHVIDEAGISEWCSIVEIPGALELVVLTDAETVNDASACFASERVSRRRLSLAETVLQEVREAQWSIGVAESCTGGLVGAALTDVAGSSDVFWGSLVTYAYEAKEAILGVRHATLVEHGAVSREVVEQMARGVVRAGGVSAALAISGIAGPGGGTPDKPVGTVWFAACASECVSRVVHLAGDRETVRRRAVVEGLVLLRSLLPRVDR